MTIQCINLDCFSVGVKYVQFVKKPNNEITFYIMFTSGLRLTVNTIEKTQIHDIKTIIQVELRSCKPSSYTEYEPYVDFITRCLEKTFTGRVQSLSFEYEEVQKVQTKWHESMFLEWLKMSEVVKSHPYELVRHSIVELYNQQS